jgi:hypothetical protein
VGEGKGTKERERVVGKAAGDECVFIPGEGPSWQIEVRSDAIPGVAGGEGGHGAANPDSVIHRCIFNQPFWHNCRRRGAAHIKAR